MNSGMLVLFSWVPQFLQERVRVLSGKAWKFQLMSLWLIKYFEDGDQTPHSSQEECIQFTFCRCIITEDPWQGNEWWGFSLHAVTIKEFVVKEHMWCLDVSMLGPFLLITASSSHALSCLYLPHCLLSFNHSYVWPLIYDMWPLLSATSEDFQYLTHYDLWYLTLTSDCHMTSDSWHSTT